MATAEQYTAQLQALLPPGAAWPRDPDAVLTRLLAGLADEFGRVDARVPDLFDEADPRTTSELLPDWERVAGLPDPCAGPAATIEARRAALVGRLTARGGQSRAYFGGLAAALGYGAVATDYAPFRAGWSAAGDPAADADRLFSAGRSCAGDPLADDGALWRYTWSMTVEPSFFTTFAAGSGHAGEPLRAWGNPHVTCLVRRRRPAHSRVWFYFTEPEEA